MGTVPGSSQKKTKEKTELCTAGWKSALQDRFPMLQKGLGAWSGTQYSRQGLVLQGQQGKHEPMPHGPVCETTRFLFQGRHSCLEGQSSRLGFSQCVKLYARPRESWRDTKMQAQGCREERSTGNSLAVQGLRLCTSTAWRAGSIPGLELRSHRPCGMAKGEKKKKSKTIVTAGETVWE